MTGKEVQPAIVIDIYQVGTLYKQSGPWQLRRGIASAAGIAFPKFDSIVTTSVEYISNAIVVHIRCADTPLCLPTT